jgi:dTDP-4-dehydrorhamnose reductase
MIYLLGGSGYIGQAFQRHLASHGIPHRSVSRAQLDYADPARLLAALRADRATFLVNAAGYTGKPNVDAAEHHKADCLFGNAILPARIAEACASAGIPWGHVSSGCIYQGARPDGSGFTETDPPNFSFRSGPCSFYSGSKALGEEILAAYPGVYQWRIRIPFDHLDQPRNYLSKLLRYERLLDARNSLTHLAEFVPAALAFATKRPVPGIYNVTNPGSVTTREVTALLAATVAPGRAFHFFDDEADFMRQAASTPRSNCVLDSAKLLATGIPLTPIHAALSAALTAWRTAPPAPARRDEA